MADPNPVTVARLWEEIKKLEQIGRDNNNISQELDTEISSLEAQKETMIKELEDKEVLVAKETEENKTNKREYDDVRISVYAAKEMLRRRRQKDFYTPRITLLKEMTNVREIIYFVIYKLIFCLQLVDDRHQAIREMLEIGPFASAVTDRNIQEEIQEEAQYKLENLKQLREEKLQFEELVKENKILRSELETMEEDLKETEETKEKLIEEAGELMKDIIEKREQSKVPTLKQEVKDLQVRLSNLRQTGKPRPSKPFRNNFTVQSNNLPLQQPPTPASKFFFKRK